ncbi:serine hydrolase [Streptomyces sp. NPDC017936]|uniref:serine hydrolase n=1 Tax=Streptomyces sp. NPDC017936 TaxID=3365016 RepID=UPI00379B1770
MEEASVAGESPDRSKQRESSAEPTSGSAGAVPEARDPRVTMARESETSASSSSRGGVDTATRVFSVRDVKTEDPAEDAAEAPVDEDEEREEAVQDASEASADSDGPDGAKSPSKGAGASEGGDGRLRSAVARWVASADEKPDADDPEESDAGKAGAESDAEGSADGGTAPEAGRETAAAAGSAPKTAPKWAVDSGEDAEDAADADAEKAAAKDADANAGEDEDDRPKSGRTGTATGAGADAETKAGADAGADAESDEPGDEPASGADAEADASDSPADASGSPVDQPTAVFKAVRPAEPAVDQPTTMLKLGGAAGAASPAADKKGEADKKDDKGDRDDKGGKGTAKAPGKAGAEAATGAAPTSEPAAEPTSKPAPEPASRPASEAEAERTSKFVALKPLDDPATRKPRPAEPAAPAEATAVVPQIGPERTTQQPLPPKPPLDLLAELTNTPPPPPTPLRTLARRVKIWTPLVLLLVVVFAVVQAVRPLPATALTLTAKDSYTFEGGKLALPWPDEGQGWMDVDGVGTMGGFGEQKPVAIGSVAKTMTAYVVLKGHALKEGEDGPSITVDATAEKEGGYDQAGESTLNSVKAGDKLTLQQALSAVMIPSANNIARLLARWDAGSEAAFVEKMNAAAKELGMTHTTYTDPSGLKETTVSTAEDQVKLGNAVVKIPALVAITSAASWTDPYGRNWSNYNELPYRMGAIGIKTGSTTAAGGNLLFAARKEVGGQTVTLVGAVLGQHKPTILKTVNDVSKTALAAAKDGLVSAKILKKGDVVGYVDDKLGGHTPVVVTKDVTAVGWAGLTVKLEFAADEVPHTAKAGTQVGTLTVGDGTSGAVKVPVALRSDLAEPGFSDKLTRIG